MTKLRKLICITFIIYQFFFGAELFAATQVASHDALTYHNETYGEMLLRPVRRHVELYADNNVSLHNSLPYYNETYGEMLLHPVRRDVDGYHLNFDNSLQRLNKPIVLFDNDTTEQVGIIQILNGILHVDLRNVNTIISQLISDMIMIFSQEGNEETTDTSMLTFDSPITSDLHVRAKRVSFLTSIHTDKKIVISAQELKSQDITAGSICLFLREFVNNHILKGNNIQILAGIGINQGQILSESNLVLGGNWTNYKTLAALGNIKIIGKRFFNEQDGDVVAGKSFISSADVYVDHGSLKSGEATLIQAKSTTFGYTFNFAGQGLRIDTDEFSSGVALHEDEHSSIDSTEEDSCGDIIVRDFFYLKAKKINGDQGKIYKDSAVSSTATAYDRLISLFGSRPYPKLATIFVDPCVHIQCDGDLVIDFDIFVQGNGSVLIEGQDIEIYGKIWHGSDDSNKTVIKAKDKVLIASNQIGDNVHIIAPVKHLEQADEDETEELKCVRLYLLGNGDKESSTHIHIPISTSFLTIFDMGRVGLFANILGYNAEIPAQIFVKAHEIYACIPDLEAKTLYFKAGDEITYVVANAASVQKVQFESERHITLLCADGAPITVLDGILLKAPHKDLVQLKVASKDIVTEGERLFTSGSISASKIKSTETASILSTADLKVDTIDVTTGRFVQLGDVKAKIVTVDGKDMVQFFAGLEAEQVHLKSGAGGTHVHQFYVDEFVSSSTGSTTLRSGEARLLEVNSEGEFISFDTLLLDEKGIISAIQGIHAKEIKAALAKLESSEGRVYVDKASGDTLSVSGATGAMVGETKSKSSTISSSDGPAIVGMAVEVDTLHLEGGTNAHAGLEGARTVTIIASDIASATGSAETLRQKGSITSADKINVRNLYPDAGTYAHIDGEAEFVSMKAPTGKVAGESTIGTLYVRGNGDVFLNEDGKTVKIGTLKVSEKGSKIYNRGTTFIETGDIGDSDIINHGMLEFTQVALTLQSLLNFGQLKFKAPSSLKVGSVMHNSGTIAGTGALDMHLENQFGIGKITVESLCELVQHIPLQGRILQFNAPETTTNYVEEVMGTEDNQCGFFALNTTRDDAVSILLHNIDKEHVRHMIGQELYRSLIEKNVDIPPELFAAADGFLKGIEILQAEVEAGKVLEATSATAEKTTQTLLKLDKMNEALKEWCCDKDVLNVYIKNVIGRTGNPVSGTTGHMLEVDREFGDTPVGTMDAIAALQGYGLEVYTIEAYQEDGTPLLTRIHTFSPTKHGFEGAFETRRIVITSADVKDNPNARNHYNILRTHEEANNWPIRLVGPQDQTGTLRMRVRTSGAPERLISDPSFRASDTIQWFLNGYQPFLNRVPVHQKTSVHVDGTAAIYGGFDAKSDFSLTADEIRLRGSDIASAGRLHLEATKRDVDADHSKVESKKDATILAADSVKLHATATEAAEKLTIEAMVDTVLESLSHRVGNGGNYHDVKDATTASAGDTLTVTAGRNNIHIGSETHSTTATIFKAGGKVIDLPLTLEHQTYEALKRGFIRNKHIHQAPSRHTSSGVILSSAQDTQELYAPILQSRAMVIAGRHGVNVHAVQDQHISEHQEKGKRGGWFGGSKTVSSSGYSSSSVGATFNATEHVKFIADFGNVVLTGVNVQAPKTVIEALKVAKILSAANVSTSSRFTTNSNVAWNRSSATSETHETFTDSKFSGEVDIHAPEVIVEQVQAETVELIHRLNLHGADLHINLLREVHTFNEKSRGGPTPALAAVVALAVGISTAGAGSALGGVLAGKMGMAASATTLTTAGSVVAGMTTGAFTAICAKASVALLSAEGDVGIAAKSLLTEDCLKDVAITSITAGISRGLGSKLGLKANPTGITQHAKHAMVHATAGAISSTTLGRERVVSALEYAARGVVAGTVGGVVANKIGGWYREHGDSYLAHKAFHAATGAGMAAILGGDKKSILGSAVAAASAEALMEAMVDKAEVQSRVIGSLTEMPWEERLSFTNPADFKDYAFTTVMPEIQGRRDLSQFLGAVAGMFAGGDIGMASITASNALDHNLIPGLIWVGMAAWEAYELKQAYNEGGLEGLAIQAGTDTALAVTGGMIVKRALQGGKAIGRGTQALRAIRSSVKAGTAAETSIAGTEIITAAEAIVGTEVVGGAGVKSTAKALPEAVVHGNSKAYVGKVVRVTREQRWMELATAQNTRLPKEVAHYVQKSDGKGVSRIYGLELAHKPKRAAAQGFDYAEALPKTIADHRGIEHRFLKERSTGTTISKPKTDGNSLSHPKPGKLI